MAKGIFIVGTDTNVGKTVVSAGLMYLLRSAGYNAAYFKPIITGVTHSERGSFAGDAEFVKHACMLDESTDIIAPIQFGSPVSPHLASVIEARSIDFDLIKTNLDIIARKYDYIVAEGCGGIAVPLTSSYYMLSDFIKDIGMDIMVVCRSGVGTINHTLLTVNYAKSLGINIRGLIINGYEGTLAEDDNMSTISDITGLPIVAVVRKLDGVDAENLILGNLKSAFESCIDIQNIISVMEEII